MTFAQPPNPRPPMPTMQPPAGTRWMFRTRGCTEPGGGIVPVFSWGLDPVSTGAAPDPSVAALIDSRVPAALAELSQKSLVQIERETAITWAARAGAAYVLYVRTRELRWLENAISYSDEAVEHAAMSCSAFCEDVRQSLAVMRQKAGVP